jgi:hypothetical protein
LKRVIMLVTVVAVTSVMLSVSASLAFAVPNETRDELKDLCKAWAKEEVPGLSVVGVDPETGEFSIVFADQGECIDFVNAGGELFAAAH